MLSSILNKLKAVFAKGSGNTAATTAPGVSSQPAHECCGEADGNCSCDHKH